MRKPLIFVFATNLQTKYKSREPSNPRVYLGIDARKCPYYRMNTFFFFVISRVHKSRVFPLNSRRPLNWHTETTARDDCCFSSSILSAVECAATPSKTRSVCAFDNRRYNTLTAESRPSHSFVRY